MNNRVSAHTLACVTASLAFGLGSAGAVTVTDNFGATGGPQDFFAPVTGVYQIYASGAAGGFTEFFEDDINREELSLGGGGAVIGGLFDLTAGEDLTLFVGATGGQRGFYGNAEGGGGGGGATTVLSGGLLLIEAGGGGGAGTSGAAFYPGRDAILTPGSGHGGAGGFGGGGGGGAGAFGGGAAGAGIAGGFGAAGQTGGSGGVAPGYPTLTGGTGGFGGGGGGSGYGAGGGGGGYTGGAGGYSVTPELGVPYVPSGTPGQGGGSYDASASPLLSFIGFGFDGDGAVAITFDNGVNPTSPTPEPATWALMLVGFGGLGAGLRAARRPMASV